MNSNQRTTIMLVNKLGAQLERLLTEQRAKLPKNFPGDFIPNYSLVDGWQALHTEEAASERQHRKFAPEGYRHTYPVADAVRLLILQNVAAGASLDAMPTALDVMTGRPTAMKARTLGFLLKDLLPLDWVDTAIRLTYSKAVRGEAA